MSDRFVKKVFALYPRASAAVPLFFSPPLFSSRGKYEKLLSAGSSLTLASFTLCPLANFHPVPGAIVDTVTRRLRNAADETLAVKFNQPTFLHRVLLTEMRGSRSTVYERTFSPFLPAFFLCFIFGRERASTAGFGEMGRISETLGFACIFVAATRITVIIALKDSVLHGNPGYFWILQLSF